MQDLNTWFAELSRLEQIFWIIAIPATLAFIIQSILAFTGMGDSDVADADLEVETDAGIGFQFFTLRNLIAFFTIFSWTGISCIDSGLSNAVSIVIAFIAGLVMMLAMAALMYFMMGLRENGTVKMKNAVGKQGETYLKIPANKKGFGKVQMSLQGSVHEFTAMCNESTDIETGSIIIVLEIVDGNILLVKPA